MTLHTRIFVKDPVNVQDLFHYGQALLHELAPEIDQQWKVRDAYVHDGARTIGNNLGQGLPAILDVTYREDGQPVTTLEQAAEHEEECKLDCDGSSHYHQAAFCIIGLDTAYAYSQGNFGCGDLHAALIELFGVWLDQHEVDWSWCNEFTGVTYHKYDNLTELGGGGLAAREWFLNVVQPIISDRLGEL